MNYFNKMKLNIKFQIISISLVLILSIGIGLLLIFLWHLEYYWFVISVLIGIIYGVVTLRICSKKYDLLRVSASNEAFKEINTNPNLTFDFRKNQPIDSFEALGLERITPLFHINSTIEGKIDEAYVTSFCAKYRPYNKKALTNSRVYIFKFEHEIKEIHLKNIKLDPIMKAEVDKVLKYKGNTIYLSLGATGKNYYYELEPIAYKTYEELKERFNIELKFLNDFINYVKNNCLEK